VIGHEAELARTVPSHVTDGTAVEDEMESRGALLRRPFRPSVLCPAEVTILDGGADKEQVLRTYRKLGVCNRAELGRRLPRA
jgi:hypothetical protein